MTLSLRILVLHEDPIAQAGLAAALSRHSDFAVVEAEAGRTMMDQVAPKAGPCMFDVVVADYRHGLSAAIEVRRRFGDGAVPRVVIVAATDRECEIRSALEHGVRGFLLTGCSLAELADAVRAVHRGARHLSVTVAARLAESMSVETLTMREEEVLRLVIEGLCNKSISRRLGIAVGTVKSHLKAAFEKLGVGSRTQAMVVAERRGILRSAPDPRKSYLQIATPEPSYASAWQTSPHGGLPAYESSQDLAA